MAGDVSRLSRVYAENVIEVFQPDQITTGREAVMDRIGSVIEDLQVSAHESRVEGIMGEQNAAMVWVKNTQTHASTDGRTFFLRPRTEDPNIPLVQNWPVLMNRR